uniref:Protein kinase domain-containing protein n=1 Tax=Acrobeloides nanus TaxID=290746 RepID=A0A914D878_9BILA
MYQILSGINYLHNSGIVHCDLSPSGIMIDHNLKLKIVHLGLIQQLDEDRQELKTYKKSIKTSASRVYGVPEEYRAPEVLFLFFERYNHK